MKLFSTTGPFFIALLEQKRDHFVRQNVKCGRLCKELKGGGGGGGGGAGGEGGGGGTVTSVDDSSPLLFDER